MIDWLLPIAIEEIHNQNEKRQIATRAWEKLFGKKTRLAITGMEGAGKSVLCDLLSGKALSSEYRKPTRSQKLEHRRARSPQKIALEVVPGQSAHPRLTALDQIFRGKTPVDGVIHVTSNGFASIRQAVECEVLVEQFDLTTIQKYRKHQLGRELASLQETCEAIRDSHRRHRAPRWMVVAVDKIDLYYDGLGKVQRQFAANSRNEFARSLRELTDQVGRDNFRWVALPVCGLLEDFTWNGNTVRSQLNEEMRSGYRARFLRELEAYCN